MFAILAFAIAATWLMPAGRYATVRYDEGRSLLVVEGGAAERTLPATQQSLSSLGVRAPVASLVDGTASKPIAIPGTYRRVDPTPQSPLAFLSAPIAGTIAAGDVILFVLVIGGFVGLFNRSGAFDAGLAVLARKLKGREDWLIVIVTLLTALGGTTFGMAEETLAFYPLLVPVFLAAGYDRMVPLAVILGGSAIGCLGSTTNPFATIIASAAAGVNWTEGLGQRAAVWAISVALLIGWTLRYARRVRRNPALSLAPPDPDAAPAAAEIHDGPPPALTPRVKLLLVVFAGAFALMILGVSRLGWWFPEMTAVFLGAAILVGLLQPKGERVDAFIDGARALLGVAFIIGVARGVSVILEAGQIDATMLDQASYALAGTSPILFVLASFLLYFLLSFVIPSSSGIAVLTMPLMGGLAAAVGVSGSSLVSAYLFGIGLMQVVAPSGMALPSLAMVGVGYDAWLKFITPVLGAIAVVCAIFLVAGL